MSIFEKLFKITIQIFFVIIFLHFSTSNAKNLDRIEKADKISNYFSGILLLNQSKFQESYSYLKKLDGLEESHLAFSKKYLYSLVNSGNFNQAFAYSKKLEKESRDNFEADLVSGVYFLKKKKFDQAKKYFLQAKNRKNETILNDYVSNSLYLWSALNKEGFENQESKIKRIR